MAISAIEYSFFRSLRKANVLPLGAEILELGQTNWYGDVGLHDLGQDIYAYAPEADRKALFDELNAVSSRQPPDLFAMARIFWTTFLQPASLTAIDFHGPGALKLDLNGPINLGRQFGIVMNLGTLEHVFDVARALRTIHDHTAPGGLMIHGLPLTGWIDHGFYNFHSTFYYDLARANDYKVVVGMVAEAEPLKFTQMADRESVLALSKAGGLGNNALIYMILRKPAEERPFQPPIQGYYSPGALSDEGVMAWTTER